MGGCCAELSGSGAASSRAGSALKEVPRTCPGIHGVRSWTSEGLSGQDERVVCGDFRKFLQWSLQAEAGPPSSDSLPLPGAPGSH